MNKSYTIHGHTFIDSDQYSDYVGEGYRARSIISSTVVKYFGFLPEWGIIIIYNLYVVVTVAILYAYLKENKPVEQRPVNTNAKEKIKDLLVEAKIAVEKK